MRILLLSWLFFVPLFQILLAVDILSVSGQCRDDQRSLLLQLKGSLRYDHSLSTKLVYWNQSQDCCRWNGVTCDKTGGVVGLDLNSESIAGGIENSVGLFGLQFLQTLNLSNNTFNYIRIPVRLNNITSLTNLNLSNAGFSGQIPIFSHLIRLVVLDLSTFYFPEIPPLKLENPNLSMLLQNHTNLTELYLDGVTMPAQGSEWCNAVSSSVPNLRVLSLRNCHLSGPIDSSLAKLHSLSDVHLSANNLASSVPEFFVNFKNLRVLHLSFCNLHGKFPNKIIQISTLQELDLSGNKFLQGTLPEFPQNGSLQTLVLSFTNFSGPIPSSIDHLARLSIIELVNCTFSGPIPSSMANLPELAHLDLSFNTFAGPIPSLRMSKHLTYFDLSQNNLTGLISSSHFEGLLNLAYIDLGSNSFNGSIPSYLFALPSLQKMFLSDNHFDCLLGGFSNGSSSLLDTLDLSRNDLGGPVPKFFFELKRLKVLSLSFNNFTDAIQLEWIQGLSNLTSLDLSYSGLSINASGSNSALSSFPQLTTLKLAKCNLRSFPDLKNQSRLLYLDLSNNQIGGKIPKWIWNVGGGGLNYLNLSYNQLVDLQKPYSIPSLSVLDLHSNILSGEIPVPPPTATIVDYSNNNFSSKIPADIGFGLNFAYFFSVSNNNLSETIPESICNCSYLQVLDLSNNSLSGMIPSCLIKLSDNLRVLNLGKNKLTGNISETPQSNCSLRTLDLSENLLEGTVPKFLENCSMLEVLNLGNNKINDTFPNFLKNSAQLRVLVLRSNKFHGAIHCHPVKEIWPNLQIIDIASNLFTGEISPKCFSNWGAMIDNGDAVQTKLNGLFFKFLQFSSRYYHDTVTVTFKGLEIEVVKILTVFTSIDFSNNGFEGVIPDAVGNLTSLYVLNLSHNSLTGPIPSSVGKLKQLESLDLSMNNLNGTIPAALGSLTFLSFLNLSYNQLVGRIPTGTQLQTFSEDSFEGNKGLCGFPLNTSSIHIQAPTSAPNVQEPISTKHPRSRPKINWKYISTELGFVFGLGVVIWPLVFCRRWRIWYYKRLDQIISMYYHCHQV